jgi:glycosyltransferase involved in cell wall biosynthesis
VLELATKIGSAIYYGFGVSSVDGNGQEINEMRVLLTLPSLSEPGGAELVAWQWARYLALQGDCVTVYTTHPEDDDLTPDGVSLVKAPRANIVAQARDLARYLKEQPMDFVVALMPYCNLISIAAARSLGVRRPKVVISAHNLARGLRTVSGGSFTPQQWLARYIYRYADLFVAVSHPVGAEAISQYGLPWNRVTVVPNPAFVQMQHRVDRSDRRDCDLTHLDIVVPARLVPQKRPLIAVDVAAALSPNFPGGIAVHFFGVGPLHDAIVDRAREAGVDVVMHGWVNNWVDRCPAGSVVLLTSIVEGFGNVLVEAAAAGFRSVVSSRCMGAADAVVPGITGELIAGDSADEYAAAVLASSREPVRDVEPWLQRFSFESSGGVLRNAMLRTANRAGRIKT